MVQLSLQPYFSLLACAHSDDDSFDRLIYVEGRKSHKSITTSIVLVYLALALLIELVLKLNVY